MKADAAMYPWNDEVYVDICGADMAVYLENVTGVRVSGGSDSFVSLRFYRVSSFLGSFSLSLLEGVALVARLESLGVEIQGDLDVPEVA
ncbi:hypothetical protein [Moritella sp.]|uniref:hypothetical protein n=1 Tax=Moritella sp. TaxID=78556 RepID=UPI001D2EFF63|nr:hypothetical protein [Moritella sp.]MCJ8350742.1 hypothetical protein [Moritella sp.]NQZ42024.1 hypothetical protein [Moritella sp.]